MGTPGRKRTGDPRRRSGLELTVLVNLTILAKNWRAVSPAEEIL